MIYIAGIIVPDVRVHSERSEKRGEGIFSAAFSDLKTSNNYFQSARVVFFIFFFRSAFHRSSCHFLSSCFLSRVIFSFLFFHCLYSSHSHHWENAIHLCVFLDDPVLQTFIISLFVFSFSFSLYFVCFIWTRGHLGKRRSALHGGKFGEGVGELFGIWKPGRLVYMPAGRCWGCFFSLKADTSPHIKQSWFFFGERQQGENMPSRALVSKRRRKDKGEGPWSRNFALFVDNLL